MLIDKLTLADTAVEKQDVDFFEDALFTIFADTKDQHGDPGQSVIYTNDVHGKIILKLVNPDAGDNGLFSHFLWNAGVQAAEMITNGAEYSVAGKSVLELGAGAGLPGIMAAIEGAREVVLSDYPSDSVGARVIPTTGGEAGIG